MVKEDIMPFHELEKVLVILLSICFQFGFYLLLAPIGASKWCFEYIIMGPGFGCEDVLLHGFLSLIKYKSFIG